MVGELLASKPSPESWPAGDGFLFADPARLVEHQPRARGWWSTSCSSTSWPWLVEVERKPCAWRVTIARALGGWWVVLALLQQVGGGAQTARLVGAH